MKPQKNNRSEQELRDWWLEAAGREARSAPEFEALLARQAGRPRRVKALPLLLVAVLAFAAVWTFRPLPGSNAPQLAAKKTLSESTTALFSWTSPSDLLLTETFSNSGSFQ